MPLRDDISDRFNALRDAVSARVEALRDDILPRLEAGRDDILLRLEALRDGASALFDEWVAMLTRLIETAITAATGQPADPEFVRVIMVGGGAALAFLVIAALLLFAPSGGDMKAAAGSSSGAKPKRAPTLMAGRKKPAKRKTRKKTRTKTKKRRTAKSVSSKRAKPKTRKKTKIPAPPTTPIGEMGLVEIEKEMRQLKTRYETGDISREDYIAGTRVLYDRAREVV